MPTKLNNNHFVCDVCNKEHNIFPVALACEQSHDLIMVPFTRAQLMVLVQLIYKYGDDPVVTQDVVNLLLKYKSTKPIAKEA